MIVAALKFFVLIAVLWWYSVTIFSIINDYFRKEFNDYLRNQAIDGRHSDTVHTPMLPESVQSNRIELRVDVPQQTSFIDGKQTNQIDNMHVDGNKQEFNSISEKSVGTCLRCTQFNYWQEIVWNIRTFDSICLVDKCVFLRYTQGFT